MRRCSRALALTLAVWSAAARAQDAGSSDQPAPAPPVQPPSGAHQAPDEAADVEAHSGRRIGTVGRAALTGSFSNGSALTGVNLGWGVRFGAIERGWSELYTAPAFAVLLNGEIDGARGGSLVGSFGLEVRAELVLVSPGGMLQPWFNCWVSGGVNSYGDSRAIQPSVWLGAGIGWNVFARGLSHWPRSTLGVALRGGILGVVASFIAAAMIGVIHLEVRVEQVIDRDLIVHLMGGIGF